MEMVHTILLFVLDVLELGTRNLYLSKIEADAWPTLRCAMVAWVSMVLFVIPSFEKAMRQASFIILIDESEVPVILISLSES